MKQKQRKGQRINRSKNRFSEKINKINRCQLTKRKATQINMIKNE